MAIELGYSLLNNWFNETTILGIRFIAGIIITAITCLIITRDIQKWKTIFFSVSWGWGIAGIPISTWQIIIAGIVFVIDTFSIQMIGQLLSTVTRKHTQQQVLTQRAEKTVQLKQIKEKIKEKLK